MLTKRFVIRLAIAVLALAAVVAGGVMFFHPDPGCGFKPDPDPVPVTP